MRKITCTIILSGLLWLLDLPAFAQAPEPVDICVYGASSAGVIAAYTAKQMGKSVILIEPGKQVGGLSSGGLGYTDIGNKFAISGIALDFYRRIGKHYGKFEQWIFEPHVAEKIFNNYLSEAKIAVQYSWRLKKLNSSGGTIKDITIENSENPSPATDRIISAKMFIDCTYEGDLMAAAGVSYTVGRESNSTYQETFNGVQLKDQHQFPDGIDPYKIKDKPESGLLWGISDSLLQPTGTGDQKVQTYNFRICLSSDPANQVAITAPAGYDPSKYELLVRLLEKNPGMRFDKLMKPDLMPNHKTDINNNGAFSTDMIGMNYGYPEDSYAARKAIQNAHEVYAKGFLFFIGHDSRVPQHLREEMLRWGYPKDEYTGNNNWSPQMYVREARRMKGMYVMTQANCQGKERITDGVGIAAYTMDSHNCQRLVIEKDGKKMVKNEGDVQEGGFPPYPISYRALVPNEKECGNLLVPVCLSASHIAYGSIRMEPVFMVLAQSSAVAACMAIDAHIAIQKIPVEKLQQILKSNPLADGRPGDIFIDNEDRSDIVIKGNWKTIKNGHGSYGASRLESNGDQQGNGSVKFSPTIPKAGSYNVYTYIPTLQGASSSILINISDGGAVKEFTLDQKKIKVEGQTSGEWVPLGTYHFAAGKKGFIEITNKKADGLVVADAALLVPVGN